MITRQEFKKVVRTFNNIRAVRLINKDGKEYEIKPDILSKGWRYNVIINPRSNHWNHVGDYNMEELLVIYDKEYFKDWQWVKIKGEEFVYE